MKLKAAGEWILIKPLAPDVKTSSGLYIPESAQSTSPKATVLSVGKDTSGVKEGDIVYYKKWVGNDHKEGEEKTLFVKIADLIAITD